jgi:hypothetical protein
MLVETSPIGETTAAAATMGSVKQIPISVAIARATSFGDGRRSATSADDPQLLVISGLFHHSFYKGAAKQGSALSRLESFGFRQESQELWIRDLQQILPTGSRYPMKSVAP